MWRPDEAMTRDVLSCAILLATLLGGCAQSQPAGQPVHLADAPTTNAHPAVIARGEGEYRLLLGRKPLYITVDPTIVGSPTLMSGWSDIAPGDSIGTHKHLNEEEILFIHRGTVDVTLGDRTQRTGIGATVFIPRGTWVGLRSVGPDTATAVFVFNTPAFEKCLRARSVRPGERYVPPTGAAYEAVQRECHEMRKGS
jgi:uncharacterized RmlC-like cupin family protein